MGDFDMVAFEATTIVFHHESEKNAEPISPVSRSFVEAIYLHEGATWWPSLQCHELNRLPLFWIFPPFPWVLFVTPLCVLVSLVQTPYG